MDLHRKYDELVTLQQINYDNTQKKIIAKLEKLRLEIEDLWGKKQNIWQKITSFKQTQHEILGLYIHGSVGRGKSMLLDLFFENLNIKRKRRVHFHAYMLEIHAMLHKWRHDTRNIENARDPIPIIAKKIAKKYNVLCFDELQVTDIADAMILGRLFQELFTNGTIIIATSNRIPDDLYKDGLQRESFLPFIDLIKQYMEITPLDAQQDYRLIHLKSLQSTYFHPLDKNSQKSLKDIFSSLTNGVKPVATTLNIMGRKLKLKKTHGDLLWISFDELCNRALGAADYIEIAKEFNTVILEDIPQMTPENRNEAKRFVTLIDELYEYKVKLIASAAVAPEELYIQGDGNFEFKRTISRLIEMQSDKYLESAHL